MSSTRDKRKQDPVQQDQRRISKAQLRQELESATRQFLHAGGKVTEVPSGTSAWEPGTAPPPTLTLFSQPRQPRTPLSDVIAALDERRAARRTRSQVRRTRKPRPRRQVIYDDFGEPLRRVWRED